MNKCSYCRNERTNHRYKLVSKERTRKERRLRGRFVVEIYVCDNHLEEAKKEYPYDISEEAP
jgi:hypothetical protein